MLYSGEHYERQTDGPYLGAMGLDFAALSDNYRRDRYADAEASKENHCFLSDSDFLLWLLETRVLTPIETVCADIDIAKLNNSYVPKHWPECPECNCGRGELEYGAVRRSLNRVAAFRRCTECRHEWAHQEMANVASLPMLEDDGRDTAGGCVPFAISKACGVDWNLALTTCAKHGWNSGGMRPDKAIVAARELGFDLLLQNRRNMGGSGALTLKRLIADLPRDRNYIVAVKDHWVAVVGGVIVDNDTDSGPGRKVLEFYEVRDTRPAVVYMEE
jgi:hypothetical protein